jgi:phytol kinase
MNGLQPVNSTVNGIWGSVNVTVAKGKRATKEAVANRGKPQVLSVFGMLIVLAVICWGLLGEKYLVIASVLAWGLGDAAAALVGKRFGAHYIEGKRIEGRKTLEGTLAMFVVSFLSVLIVLLIKGAVVWYGYVPTAAITATVSAVVELFSRNGRDTWTCPFAAAAVLIPLIYLLGA